MAGPPHPVVLKPGRGQPDGGAASALCRRANVWSGNRSSSGGGGNGGGGGGGGRGGDGSGGGGNNTTKMTTTTTATATTITIFASMSVASRSAPGRATSGVSSTISQPAMMMMMTQTSNDGVAD